MRSLEDNYSWLKSITTILVVVGHATRFFYNGMGVVDFENEPVLNVITVIIYSFHMPLFIFISGVIYKFNIMLGKYQKFSLFFVKKFKRLMVPYIFWGGLCVAPVMTAFNFTSQSYLEYLFKGILASTNARHLWYLWALFGMFLIVNSLQHVIRDSRKFLILLFAAGLFGAVIYEHTTWVLSIGYICQYFIYFVLGMQFRNSRIETIISEHPLRYFFISLSGNLIFTFAFNNVITKIIAACFGISFMYSVSCLERSKKFFIQNTLFGKNTFGVYLAHPMLIYVLMYFYKTSGLYLKLSPLMYTPIVIIVTIWLSTKITVFIRKLKFSFLIGEME